MERRERAVGGCVAVRDGLADLSSMAPHLLSSSGASPTLPSSPRRYAAHAAETRQRRCQPERRRGRGRRSASCAGTDGGDAVGGPTTALVSAHRPGVERAVDQRQGRCRPRLTPKRLPTGPCGPGCRRPSRAHSPSRKRRSQPSTSSSRSGFSDSPVPARGAMRRSIAFHSWARSTLAPAVLAYE